ncbi:MAG: hypothetical protein HYS13_14250 [Planctomycetia bacterium]|nr:hypothetical protein [Planctomycetia bacterium]
MTATPLPAARRVADVASLRRAVVAAGTCLLVLAAAVLVARRASGSWDRPLSGAALFVTGLLLAAGILGLHVLRQRGAVAIFGDWVVLPFLSSVIVAAALWLPGSPTWGVAAILLLPTAAEASRMASVLVRRSWQRTAEAASREERFEPPAGAELPKEIVYQRWTRRVTAEGSDVLEAQLQVAFQPRQRTAHVHLAFCPPFAAVPELSVERADGPEARIKAARVLAYAARLEVKLAEAAEDTCQVAVDVIASGRGTSS